MEQEKKFSKALEVKMEYQNVVNNTSTKTAAGKNEYYTTNLKPNNYTKKDGTEEKGQVFSLKNHQNEEVQFNLTNNGVMKSATYIHWEGNTPEKTFLAKDINKLKEVAMDAGLVEMAAKFNWEKITEKEQEAEQDGYLPIPGEIIDDLPIER